MAKAKPATKPLQQTHGQPKEIIVRLGSTPSVDTSKSNLDLDLDVFYHARLRRRAQFAQQISNTLAAAGIATDSATANEKETASLSTKRGTGMTLSPGEEYENYQKVLATMMEDDAMCAVEDGLDEVRKEEDEGGECRLSKAKTSPINNQDIKKDASERKAADITIQRGPSRRRAALDADRNIRSKEDLQRSSVRMVDPLGRFRLFWDLSSITFIFYNAIVLPFKASFDVEAKDNLFEAVIDVYFLIDILLTFNTAVEKDGSIRSNRRLVAERYLKTWFIVDLIAALPYGDIFTKDGNYSAALRRSVKLLRLVRLLRLFRVSRIVRRIQNVIFIRSTLSSLMKYCLMLVFFNHWFSCIFYAIASSNIENSWIKAQGLDGPNVTKWDRYVAALYFSVQTLSTIGFGDVAAQSANERLFCIFAMIVGGGFFAYGITNIVELVSSLTIQETVFRQKLDEVNEYMKARELPANLRMEIRDFYHNTRLSRESKLNSEQQILNDLSSKLRSKIALSINDQFLRKFPFFTGSEPNFLMELALNMRVIHFAPLEDAIIEGETGHEMFFIFRGAVEVVKDNVRIGVLGENQYFGEMAILSTDSRRTATVRTLCFCELRVLSRTRFLEALALFPGMQSKMAQIAQGRAAATNLDTASKQQKSTHPSACTIATALAMSSTKSRHQSLTLEKPSIAVSVDESATKSTAPPSPKSRSPSPKSRSPTRLSLGALLPADQRPPHVHASTSARISGSLRHSSSDADSIGVSPRISTMITDVFSLLEEAIRRQDMLVEQIVHLKKELDRTRTPVTNAKSPRGPRHVNPSNSTK